MVIPTRNRVALLPATLDTVLHQRGVDLEVLVVDDASEDGTATLVNARADGRLRLLSNARHQGVSRARNRGIAEAGGAWVAFCDDDDLWAPDKLRRQLAEVVRCKRGWVYAGAVDIDRQDRVHAGAPPLPPEAICAAMTSYNAMPAGASNVVVDRRLVWETGGFTEELSHFADWDLWLRLLEAGTPACVPHPLVGYRQHPANASLDFAGMLADLRRLEMRHDIRVDRVRVYRHLGRLGLRVGRRRDAVGYLALAMARAGRGYDTAALRQDVRLLADHGREAWQRRRPGRPPPATRRRHRVGSAADPHQHYKDEARRWLSERRVN